MRRLVGILLVVLGLGATVSAEDILTKYTFIPGEEQIVYEDLSTTPVGEAPPVLHLNGDGEVVVLGGQRWLKLLDRAELNLRVGKHDDLTLEFEMRASETEYTGIDIWLQNEDEQYSGWVAIFGEGASWEGSYLDENLPSNAMRGRLFGPGETATVALTMQKNRFKVYVNRVLVMSVTDFAPVIADLITLRGGEMEFVGVRNFRVSTGIPDIALEIMQNGKYSSHGVHFDTASAKIKEASHYVLKQVAEVLQGNPDVRLRIVGHTDSIGDKASNRTLSLQRAESVKAYLVQQFSIAPERLETEGRGDEQPVGDNRTPEGRALNRRVEFIRLP